MGALRPPLSAPTEATLVQAMLPGAHDRDRAWGEFYRRHGGRLLGFIRSTMGPARFDDCEDLLEETVVRIEKNLPRYEHRREGGFHSWCVKIAHNLCRSAFRVRAGHPTPDELVSFSELEERLESGRSEDDWPVVLAPDEDDPALSENEQIFNEAFGTLNEVDQAVIHFRHVAPVPDKQIAVMVGKPETQIRMIRDKAMKKLRRACERIRQQRRRR